MKTWKTKCVRVCICVYKCVRKMKWEKGKTNEYIVLRGVLNCGKTIRMIVLPFQNSVRQSFWLSCRTERFRGEVTNKLGKTILKLSCRVIFKRKKRKCGKTMPEIVLPFEKIYKKTFKKHGKTMIYIVLPRFSTRKIKKNNI